MALYVYGISRANEIKICDWCCMYEVSREQCIVTVRSVC